MLQKQKLWVKHQCVPCTGLGPDNAGVHESSARPHRLCSLPSVQRWHHYIRIERCHGQVGILYARPCLNKLYAQLCFNLFHFNQQTDLQTWVTKWFWYQSYTLRIHDLFMMLLEPPVSKRPLLHGCAVERNALEYDWSMKNNLVDVCCW